jgi:hypothetical protein
MNWKRTYYGLIRKFATPNYRADLEIRSKSSEWYWIITELSSDYNDEIIAISEENFKTIEEAKGNAMNWVSLHFPSWR